MTRVLVIRNAYDQDAGGAEQFALNLCLALETQGHQPLLMTRVPNIVAKAQAAGIPVKRGMWHATQEWGKHYFWRFPATVLWYVWFIIVNRIQVVHAQGRDDFIFATYAAKLLGKRIVWTDHADLKVVMNLDRHPFPWLRKWIVGASHYVHAVMCVSRAELEEIKAVAPELESKLVLVHNGVFLPEHVQPAEKDAEFVIVTNARLVPDKGIGELLEAFAASTYKTRAKLWLLGADSGNTGLYQQKAAELRISGHVRFVGYVSNPNDYVAAADVFVHASHHEAFSLAIIEAAMLGRAIIATNVGGAAEIITEETGILIPPKDAVSITTALDALLSDPVRRQTLGERAKMKAATEFDFTKIVKEKVIPLYEDLH
ncbi:MAG TPA: glycosyltransferase [Candidatus Saccharimonadales bacterium]|nr:glycosyltransferase [Candidatus Saccharimonadales bacterium]